MNKADIAAVSAWPPRCSSLSETSFTSGPMVCTTTALACGEAVSAPVIVGAH